MCARRCSAPSPAPPTTPGASPAGAPRRASRCSARGPPIAPSSPPCSPTPTGALGGRIRIEAPRPRSNAAIRLYFAPLAQARRLASSLGLDAGLAARGAGYTQAHVGPTHGLSAAVAVIRDELAGHERRATIVHELYHALGPGGHSPWFPASVVYRGAGATSSASAFAPVDLKTLGLLYRHLERRRRSGGARRLRGALGGARLPPRRVVRLRRRRPEARGARTAIAGDHGRRLDDRRRLIHRHDRASAERMTVSCESMTRPDERAAQALPPRAAAISLSAARRQQARVVGDGDEGVALVDLVARRSARRGVHPRRQTVAPGRGKHRLAGFEHVRRCRLGVGRVAEADGEVVGADIDAVEAGDRHDRVHIVHRFGRLDHRHRDNGVVGLRRIVGAAVEQAARGTETAVARRRVAAGADEAFALPGGVDHRADDAVGAGVEQFHDRRRVVPRNPRQRRRRISGHGGEHGNRVGEVDHAVLGIDGDAVEGRVGHGLRRKGVRDGEPAVNNGAALLPDRPHPVLTHRPSLPRGVPPTGGV